MAKNKNNDPQTLEEALEVIASLNTEKAEQAELVSDLRAQLKEKSKAVEAKENIVEHDGKKYKVNCGAFHFNGEKHPADSLKENKEMLAELVEIGAGFLEEVE